MFGAKKIIHQNARRGKGNNRETTSGSPLGLTRGRLPESVHPGIFPSVAFQQEPGFSASGHDLPFDVPSKF